MLILSIPHFLPQWLTLPKQVPFLYLFKNQIGIKFRAQINFMIHLINFT